MDALKTILGNVAPFIGTMIGGPFGAAAGKVLGSFLLGNENASLSEIETALATASPEQLVKLREIDTDYKKRMAELGLDEQKVAAMDRDSARKREMMLKDKIPSILAILLTLGFFGILVMIMLVSIPEEAKGVVQVMIGSLGTAWIAVVTYYFGSSQGSSVKTYLLGERKN